MPTDKVQVAVRLRPVNKRELELGTKCVVDMEENQTILYHPSDSPLDSGGAGGGGGTDRGRRKTPKTFAFDHCFWSVDKDDPKFSSQENVFNHLGQSVLQRAFEGYNGCIFAYGQTGSGKSYTMMGTLEEKGIIPRLCDALFEGIQRLGDESTSFKVEVSYMEIYNEKVHDLLDPKGSKQNLKVREHNILGPYVDGLSMLVVESFEDINNLMSEGNKSRTVAATNMNSESSRSHAVFNIILTQTLVDLKTSVSGEKVSKLSLVDLAGSERAQKTGAMGDRLREGSNINKSLTTLGLVISALADQGGGGKSKHKFVPYRDSVLTWLLKDNLGGNSKTVMICTISPAGDNYEETLSSLRYADRAKRIVNHAVVNEDPNARIIRELRLEVETLHKELEVAQSMKAPDLKEKLEESEKLLREMRKTWEEKLTETEKIHQERHQALVQMGVSVETSGIKVEHGRYFLVNLNADPSLNELLVYYLKEKTVVGCPNAETTPDIQLSGLGIQPEHCIVEIEDSDVFVSPFEGARTCVNGSVIQQRTRVRHGDRILWGNNHFFRINCPTQNNVSMTQPDADETIDYNYAQQELMLKEFSNDPISEAISAVEQQYEEDKQEALEKQRQMYERQMQMLRYQLMSPGTPSMPFPPMDMSKLTPTGSQSGIQRKYQQWAQERDKMFKQSLCKLREEVVKANALVREANFLAEEMGKQTEFHVTLQIPAANLSPNRRKGAFVSEPAILVRRKHRSSQIWAMEKFENKIIDMRDMYEERKRLGVPIMVDDSDESESDDGPPQKGDPFYESHENHNLIGVANVFLDCLFYDVKLDYHVPIISQQGEIAGKLHVEISKLGGAIMDRYADINCSDSEDEEEEPLPAAKPLVIRVKIHEARNLPKDLSHFVFCQYSFWGYEDPISVPPYINPNNHGERKNVKTVKFTHERDFKVYMSEEFVEHAQEGALSIEVWGHKSLGFGHQNSVRDSVSRTNSLAERWDEVTRKIELWAEIQEVNDQGEYAPVEVKPQPEVPSAGVFQLRQGHARRILTRVKPTANSGTLPLICESITSVSVGCVCNRSKLQKGLDSYQEEDLNLLRERWSEALSRRHEYLDSHIHKLINKQDKTESDSDRERALIDQWVSLTEERNAVLVPAAGSGIPGAPANWEAPADMEQHRPVLFLDLNSDDMTTPTAKEGLQAAGINSILPKEQSANFIVLPILKTYTEKENVCAVMSWDSSIHDCPHLNRLTNAHDRVYMILKAVIRLSHPAYMELVLRKRLCINIKQRNMSLTDKLKKRWIGTEGLKASGITYDVVSNIPKASEDLEEMETLAQMAASQNEVSAADGETYIEKYIKGVSAVESILTLDRLRQEVAVKELMTAQGRPLQRTASVPNMHQFVTTPPRLDEKMRFDSIQDLSLFDKKSGTNSNTSPGESHSRKRAFSLTGYDITTIAKELMYKFGLARPNSLDLRVPSLTAPGGRAAMSPLGVKVSLMKPLQTLQEEHHREAKPLLQRDSEEEDDSPVKSRPPKPQDSALTTTRDAVHTKLNNIIEPDPSSIGSDDFQEFESYQSQQIQKIGVPHSGTSDSIAEGQFKGTPSMTSSGYGSQAVSTLTLSSEDSLSLRSNDDSEATRARKSGIEHASSGESDGDETVQAQGGISISQGGISLSQSGIDVNKDDEKSLKSEDSQATLNVEAETESTDSFDSQKEVVDVDVGVKMVDILSIEERHKDSSFDNKRLESTGFEANRNDRAEVEEDNKRLESTVFEMNVDDKTEQEVDRLAVSEVTKDVEKMSLSTDSDEDDDVIVPESLMLHISEEDLRENGEKKDDKLGIQSKDNLMKGNIEDIVVKGDEVKRLPDQKESLNKIDKDNTEETADRLSEAESDRDTDLVETAAGYAPVNKLHDDFNSVSATSHNKMSDRQVDMLESMDTSVASADISVDAPNSNRLPSTSDSSSMGSRGVLGSDSIDPYSLEAMDELERLGEECGEDNSEFLSIDEKFDSSSVSQGNKSLTETDKERLDESLGAYGHTIPKSQSTPKGAKGGNQRPVSCIGLSQKEINEAFHKASSRLSGDFSDTVSEDSMSVCSFGSRADLDRLQEVPVPSWIQVGESVIVTSSRTSSKMTGVVQFVGNVEFAHGPWVGVELDLPEGKNDGSVNQIRYFRCRPRHGIFVRHDKLIWDKKRKGSRKAAAMNRRSLNAQSVSPAAKGGSGGGRRK